MAKLIGLAVLLFVLGCGAAASPSREDLVLDPRLQQPAVVDPKASGECFNAGERICSASCKQLLLCVLNGADWEQVVVQNCTAGRWCDAKEGSCHLGLSTCAPTDPPAYRLHCTASGVFPDPYDCTVYHVCLTSGVTSDVRNCASGWAYNALTTTCNLRFDSRPCVESPIPLCQSPGDSGPVIENPNIYYICIGQITGSLPEFYRCEGDFVYENGACIDPTASTTTAVPTTTSAVPSTEVPPTSAPNSVAP